VTLAFVPETAATERVTPFPMPDLGQRSPGVSIRDLTKSFATRRNLHDVLRHPLSRSRSTILHGINLDIAGGEMFGILGLNGAGKTTLLKLLATLILPDAGTASVGGCDILEDPRVVRAILAMVTADERSLNWRLSARENVRLYAGLNRMGPREGATRTDEVLASVGLEHTADKLVGAFSSGMRQRLLLARALLARPRVLLLDEPTRSLDPVAAHEFRRLLRDDLVERHGVTVILATHNPEEAFNYCDRVVVLHQGTIAALGSARALAMRFGQERYRIWSRNGEHSCFDALVLRGLVTELVRQDESQGTRVVECTIPGGEAKAAEVLRRLVEGNVTVTRFERAVLPLSALIARIVETHSGSNGGAIQNA
jgi:ABC-2 type transport system ATP-binding protein